MRTNIRILWNVYVLKYIFSLVSSSETDDAVLSFTWLIHHDLLFGNLVACLVTLNSSR